MFPLSQFFHAKLNRWRVTLAASWAWWRSMRSTSCMRSSLSCRSRVKACTSSFSNIGTSSYNFTNFFFSAYCIANDFRFLTWQVAARFSYTILSWLIVWSFLTCARPTCIVDGLSVLANIGDCLLSSCSNILSSISFEVFCCSWMVH